MRVDRRARRAEGFAVRRWLQLGAASAGVGAGLLGFSLLGPQIGSAAAESAGESGTSASAPAPSDNDDTGDTTTADAKPDGGDDDHATDEPDGTEDEDDSDLADAPEGDADSEPSDDEDGLAEDDAEDDAEDVDEPEPADRSSALSRAAEDSEPTVDSPQTPPSVPAPKPSAGWSEVTGRAIDTWTSDSQGWIRSLPVDGAAKYHLGGALWATRRTLFNQAPSVAPVQISGKLDGPVTGTVGAVDPDGDRLKYVVTRGPASGTVRVNADGTYTYTPGTDFDGVDTFRIVAIDIGPHVNLLDPFRAVGTRADNLVNQRAIRFTFAYRDGAEHWTPERRAALNAVADQLVEYLTVTQAVTVTYDILGESDANSGTLAWAWSESVSQEPGYWRTVVQNKIISGVDANGDASDGQISYNFGYKWALGETVAGDEFDFTPVAIHEILHSFGFMSFIERAGENGERNRVVFDQFVVTADGTRPIDSDFVWDTQFDPYLTGQNGGLYFGGPNAVAAYGGLVPLFTPNPWRPGSSMSHVDDFTFTGADIKVMNALAPRGPRVRVLSPVELAILRDIGYRVDAPLRQL